MPMPTSDPPGTGNLERSGARELSPPCIGRADWQRMARLSDRGEVPDLPPSRFRFHLILEIVNFGLLRRYLGVSRVDALGRDVLAYIAVVAPHVRGTIRSSRTLEVCFEADRFAALQELVDELRRAFADPVTVDGEPHHLRLLLGGAGGAVAECDEVRLVEGAERALADARLQGSDVLHDLAVSSPGMDPLTFAQELPRALSQGEFFLQYQPKIHVRRQQVASVEALVRWQHPDLGLVLPGDFIEAAEQSEAIVTLTLWILRKVIEDQRWLAAAGHDFPVFINISGVLLADARFVEDACGIIQAADGTKIGFEITETAVIRDPDVAIAHLNRFSAIGVALAIDDYGAGLSSLAYLKQLPAGELKIDKLFVTQLTSSNRDPLIVRSTIDLAHALDMEVTAEGVETPAAMALLSVMGCDMVQGYLISRPIAILALRQFLDDQLHLETLNGPRLSFTRPDRLWKTG